MIGGFVQYTLFLPSSKFSFFSAHIILCESLRLSLFITCRCDYYYLFYSCLSVELCPSISMCETFLYLLDIFTEESLIRSIKGKGGGSLGGF